MKRSVLVFLMAFTLLLGGLSLKAQEQPAPKKDTVNMDSNAKPEFYYAVEDDATTDEGKSSSSTVIIIAVAVVVVAGVVVVVLRKKKK
ncbi:MAG TPA: hypothetical protein VHO46_09940 [Bacteroidales bacterium]|nr:hypothetical protein [Bacteroidales bacterium]